MIANIQLQQAMSKVILSNLKKGNIPTSDAILKSIASIIPNPGSPATKYSPQLNGNKVDVYFYNKTWEGIANDLSVLYSQIYEHISRVSTDAERLFYVSAGIDSLIGKLTGVLQSLNYDESIIDSLVVDFSTNLMIDLDTATTLPEAYIDYSNGCVRLPINTGTYVAANISKAQISGSPVSGSEEPIIGSQLSWILNGTAQQAWMTQVLSGGGGCSYNVTIILPSLIKITNCNIILTHPQSIQVSYLINGVWEVQSNTNSSASIEGVNITLSVSSGQASNNQFLYTFGIQQVILSQQAYVSQATITTLPLRIDLYQRSPLQLLLSADQLTPIGTDVSYAITLSDSSGAPISGLSNIDIQNNIPLALTASASNWVPITSTYLFYSSGNPIAHYRVSNACIDKNLLLSGSGVYFGEGQWQVSAYEYDWSFLPDHTPGPSDWSDLGSLGITDNQVLTYYCDMERSSHSIAVAPNRFDIITGPTNGTFLPNMTYRYQTDVYCTAPQVVVIPGQEQRVSHIPPCGRYLATQTVGSSILDDISTLASNAATTNGSSEQFCITAYVQGPNDTTPVLMTSSLNGMTWMLRQGWNTISVYIESHQTRTLPISLGLSLTPQSYLGVNQRITDHSVSTYHYLDFDATVIPSAPQVGTEMPVTTITAVRATKSPLQQCSLFDLRYNTPYAFQGRYAAVVDTSVDINNTDIYIPYSPGARVAICYQSLATDTSAISSAIISATLNTDVLNLESTPQINSISLKFS